MPGRSAERTSTALGGGVGGPAAAPVPVRVPTRLLRPRDDLVVLDAVVLLDQEALVLGVVDGGLDVVAREAADRVERVPERVGDELGAVVLVAAQHPGAAVAGCLQVLRDAG